jgi:hypothetical protein
MGLLDFTVPSTEVTLAAPKGGKPAVTMTVRGLSFADLSALLVKHGTPMIGLYGKVMAEAEAGKLDGSRVGQMIQMTLEECPELMAEVIVRASDTPVTPQSLELARKIPMTAQIEALLATVEHTFVSEAEVKKLVEIVTKAMEQATDLVGKINQTSPGKDGSGASVAA